MSDSMRRCGNGEFLAFSAGALLLIVSLACAAAIVVLAIQCP